MKKLPRRCADCGDLEHEDLGLEYNDQFFCSLNCKLRQQQKEERALVEKVHTFPTQRR